MAVDKVVNNRDIICAKLGDLKPKVGIILGSGLGPLADEVQDPVKIDYADLDGFPVPTVVGHGGSLIVGKINGVCVACMNGRRHFYEGRGFDEMKTAVRTLKLIGCEVLFVTNAAGSVRKEVAPGSVVVIKDHINFLPGNPLIGANDDAYGPRFFSMANAYDKELRDTMAAAAKDLNIELPDGVYVAYSGPNFETAAEIRMFGTIGGTVVGMSSVPEVLLARHCGMKVIMCSAITNYAEGLTDVVLSHEQTLKSAKLCTGNFLALIMEFLKRLA